MRWGVTEVFEQRPDELSDLDFEWLTLPAVGRVDGVGKDTSGETYYGGYCSHPGER